MKRIDTRLLTLFLAIGITHATTCMQEPASDNSIAHMLNNLANFANQATAGTDAQQQASNQDQASGLDWIGNMAVAGINAVDNAGATVVNAGINAVAQMRENSRQDAEQERLRLENIINTYPLKAPCDKLPKKALPTSQNNNQA